MNLASIIHYLMRKLNDLNSLGLLHTLLQSIFLKDLTNYAGSKRFILQINICIIYTDIYFSLETKQSSVCSKLCPETKKQTIVYALN